MMKTSSPAQTMFKYKSKRMYVMWGISVVRKWVVSTTQRITLTPRPQPSKPA